MRALRLRGSLGFVSAALTSADACFGRLLAGCLWTLSRSYKTRVVANVVSMLSNSDMNVSYFFGLGQILCV